MFFGLSAAASACSGFKHFDSFMNDYEFIAYTFDKIKRKTFLGQNTGRCRFCKRSTPEISFKQDPHVFPQFITNKYLLSNYECDDCNELFSRTLENEMANFMKLLHTTYGVKGERKIPTYINNRIRFEFDGRNLKIEDFDNSLLTGSLNDRKFSINLTTDEFVPIAVFKCLTKMALSIIPETEILFFTKTFKWLQEEDHVNSEFKVNNLWIIHSQLTGDHKFPHVSATLLKKKSEIINSSPTFIFILTYSKFSFQIYLPLCDLDTKKTFSIQDLSYCPHLIDIANQYISFVLPKFGQWKKQGT